MCRNDVLRILLQFDGVFTPPLHDNLDFEQYSEKLSQHAHFILVEQKGHSINHLCGFVAYYLNCNTRIIYIPLIAVAENSQTMGVGRKMLDKLIRNNPECAALELEVKKGNDRAFHFYIKYGFQITEDKGNSYLMTKYLRSNKG